MEPNERTEQKRIVVDSPGARREVITEHTQRGPDEGPSMGTIALIALVVIAVVGIVLYVVTNRNANESANRNANIDVATQAGQANQAQPQTVIQQPAQQAPVIIQQPAQPAPVIIQQPAQAAAEDTSTRDDLAMQDAATKMLLSDPDLNAVSIAVSGSRAALTGTANTQSIKDKAERLVRSVRGVKSVDNKIYVAGT